MVDRTNLERVTNLYAELRTLDAAIGNFDNGGLIVSMTVSTGPPSVPGPPPPGPPFVPRMPVSVSTVGMAYPPTMVAAIKEQFTARQAAIGQELTSLGVTGT